MSDNIKSFIWVQNLREVSVLILKKLKEGLLKALMIVIILVGVLEKNYLNILIKVEYCFNKLTIKLSNIKIEQHLIIQAQVCYRITKLHQNCILLPIARVSDNIAIICNDLLPQH